MSLNKLNLSCQCHGVEHDIVVWHDRKDNEVTIFVQMYQWLGFWKRVVRGIKWIFGTMPPCGHWDSTILNYHGAKKLHELLGVYLDAEDIKK